MYEDLTHALGNFEIQPGESRIVKVRDYELEIRRPPVKSLSEFEDMVMIEPWTEFPRPGKSVTLTVTPGKLPLPDPPEIPSDFEEMGMIEPWVTLPDPKPIATFHVRRANHPMPVAPAIPAEDDVQ